MWKVEKVRVRFRSMSNIKFFISFYLYNPALYEIITKLYVQSVVHRVQINRFVEVHTSSKIAVALLGQCYAGRLDGDWWIVQICILHRSNLCSRAGSSLHSKKANMATQTTPDISHEFNETMHALRARKQLQYTFKGWNNVDIVIIRKGAALYSWAHLSRSRWNWTIRVELRKVEPYGV